MSAATVVGRLGPLAAALGTGVLIAASGAGVATADSAGAEGPRTGPSAQPGSPTESTGPSARPGTPPGSPVQRHRGRLARDIAPAAQTRPAAVSADRRAVTPPGARAVARAAVNPVSWLGALFNNQTPRMSPAQTSQDAGGVVRGVLNAVDPDSPRLTFSVAAQAAHGTVRVSDEGSWTYTPDESVAAAGVVDAFDVSVSDAASGFAIHGLAGLVHLLTFGLLGSRGDSSTATVRVVVAPFAAGNTAPTGTVAISGTDPVSGVVTGVVTGSDPDGDPLAYTAPAVTAKGAVSVDALSGAFTYTPTAQARAAAAAPGAPPADRADAFTVTVADGRGGTALVVVAITIVPAATPPPPPPPSPSLVAFPGAEGFGAAATGGRDGSVIYVTNLDASGPGSLQWAIDQPGARYILFKVSGVINARIHLTNGDVTIAGQTSPGGITVRGFVTDETPYQDQAVRAPTDFAENWILQHIRIRPGAGGPSDDGLRLRYTRNAIVDHVSIGNATDEAIEISYSNNITVQNTIIAETVGGHSFFGGVLMNYSNPAHGFALDNVSLHHNVFNRIEGRLPEGSRESPAAAGSFMNLELSNNLYWDPNFFIALGMDTGVAGGQPIYWKLNAVNNFFQTRADFPYAMFDDQILRVAGNQLFVSGNRMNLYPARSDYQLFYCCNDYRSTTSPGTGSGSAQARTVRHPFPVITYTPTDQLRATLLATAGAWPRDPMDTRLMGSVASNSIASGARNVNPAGDALLPAFTGTAPAAPADTDNDGMPDTWEISKGLNPAVANTNARTLSPAGYTDLEVYLYELSVSRLSGLTV